MLLPVLLKGTRKSGRTHAQGAFSKPCLPSKSRKKIPSHGRRETVGLCLVECPEVFQCRLALREGGHRETFADLKPLFSVSLLNERSAFLISSQEDKIGRRRADAWFDSLWKFEALMQPRPGLRKGHRELVGRIRRLCQETGPEIHFMVRSLGCWEGPSGLSSMPLAHTCCLDLSESFQNHGSLPASKRSPTAPAASPGATRHPSALSSSRLCRTPLTTPGLGNSLSQSYSPEWVLLPAASPGGAADKPRAGPRTRRTIRTTKQRERKRQREEPERVRERERPSARGDCAGKSGRVQHDRGAASGNPGHTTARLSKAKSAPSGVGPPA